MRRAWSLLGLGLVAAAALPVAAGDPDPGALLDEIVPPLLEEHHVPGVAVVLVRGEEIVASRGYGVSDLASRRPVDPETTLFRIASISKLITATAAMQLVEEGLLDLDRDLRGSLGPITLEAAPGVPDVPVTLRHLLSHGASFDESILDGAQPLDVPLPPLETYLAGRLTPRLRAPGEIIVYSNLGYALIGHLIERASGRPYEDRVRETILEPLGMGDTWYGVPRPTPERMARPHAWLRHQYVDPGYDRMQVGPAGDWVSTATDLARFASAHLGGGRFGEARILGEETVRVMQDRQLEHHPDLTAYGLGFITTREGGQRAVGHPGAWRGFSTLMFLLPDEGFGFICLANLDVGFPFLAAVRDRLGEELGVLEPEPELEPDRASIERLAPLEGTYLAVGRPRGDVTALAATAMELRLAVQDDGGLQVAANFGEPRVFVEHAPGALRSPDGHEARWSLDDEGRVSALWIDGAAFEPISAASSPRNQLIALLLATLVLLLIGLGAVLVAGLRLVGWVGPSTVDRATAVAAVVLVLSEVVFVVLLVDRVLRTPTWEYASGVPRWAVLLGLLPWVGAASTAWLGLGGRRGRGGRLAKAGPGDRGVDPDPLVGRPVERRHRPLIPREVQSRFRREARCAWGTRAATRRPRSSRWQFAASSGPSWPSGWERSSGSGTSST